MMHSLKKVLNTVQSPLLKKLAAFERLRSEWNSMFPANLTNNCQPLRWNQSTLVLMTSSPVWAHKLQMEQAELIRQLKAKGWRLQTVQFVAGSRNELNELKRDAAQKTSSLTQAEDTSEVPPSLEACVESMEAKTVETETARAAKGWRHCPVCQTTWITHPQTQCLFCHQAEERRQEQQLQKTLREVPWIRYEESGLSGVMSEHRFLIEKQKLEGATRKELLIGSLYEDKKLKRPERERLARRYISLRTGMSPQDMTEPMLRQSLGKRLAGIVFDRG